MARIGKKQLRTLMSLGAPHMVLITPDKVSESLVRRGLLKHDSHVPESKACRITPDGLRVLADEMEAGRVDDLIESLKAKPAE